MKEKIEKTKAELENVEELKKCIFQRAKSWFEADASKVDTHEFGEIIDVVKDLAQVHKYCWEALYFESVVKAMEEEHEMDEEMTERYGYNPNRYPSSGRYASKGHGTRMGYPMMEPEMWARRASERFGYPVYFDGTHDGMGDIFTGYGINGMPGYSGSRGASRDGSSGMNNSSDGSNSGRSGASGGSQLYSGYPMGSEYGREYDMYRESRRHYTETKDADSKREMDHHAEEHLKKSIQTIRDIWSGVDPTLKKKMKMDLQALVGEMNV